MNGQSTKEVKTASQIIQNLRNFNRKERDHLIKIRSEFANGAATAAMAYAFNHLGQSRDPVEEWLSASESLAGEIEIVRTSSHLSPLKTLQTLFPSYASFARSFGVSDAALVLFEVF